MVAIVRPWVYPPAVLTLPMTLHRWTHSHGLFVLTLALRRRGDDMPFVVKRNKNTVSASRSVAITRRDGTVCTVLRIKIRRRTSGSRCDIFEVREFFTHFTIVLGCEI